MSNSVNLQVIATAQQIIPQTDVETETLLDPLKYLAYLCPYAQVECVVVQPLNQRNFESWSDVKAVDNIANRNLIVTIEMIKDGIILGIDEDLDDRVVKIGVMLILESQDRRYALGTIFSICKLSKEIPYPKRSPKMQLSFLRVQFEKYVKANRIAFARSKFFPVGAFPQSCQHQLITGLASPLRYKMTCSDGDWFEGDFSGSLTGMGKLTMPSGEIWRGIFENGRLVRGTIEDTEGGLSKGDFNDKGLNGKGFRSYKNLVTQKGKFLNGRFVKGTMTFPGDSYVKGSFLDGDCHGTIFGCRAEFKMKNGKVVDGYINPPHGLITPQIFPMLFGVFPDFGMPGFFRYTEKNLYLEVYDYTPTIAAVNGSHLSTSGKVEQTNFFDDSLRESENQFLLIGKLNKSTCFFKIGITEPDTGRVIDLSCAQVGMALAGLSDREDIRIRLYNQIRDAFVNGLILPTSPLDFLIEQNREKEESLKRCLKDIQERIVMPRTSKESVLELVNNQTDALITTVLQLAFLRNTSNEKKEVFDELNSKLIMQILPLLASEGSDFNEDYQGTVEWLSANGYPIEADELVSALFLHKEAQKELEDYYRTPSAFLFYCQAVHDGLQLDCESLKIYAEEIKQDLYIWEQLPNCNDLFLKCSTVGSEDEKRSYPFFAKAVHLLHIDNCGFEHLFYYFSNQKEVEFGQNLMHHLLLNPHPSLFRGILFEKEVQFEIHEMPVDQNSGLNALRTCREAFSNDLASLSGQEDIHHRLQQEVYLALTSGFIALESSMMPDRVDAESFSKSQTAYLLYCEAFRRNLPLGIESTLVFAEINNVSLYIWELVDQSHELVLKGSFVSKKIDQSQPLHLLHSQGNHFDRLNPSENIDMNLVYLPSGSPNPNLDDNADLMPAPNLFEKYIKRLLPLDRLGINKENPMTSLKSVKTVDLLNSRGGVARSRSLHSSYHIRQMILDHSSSRLLTTAAVYTHSLNPADWVRLDYLMDPANWLNERVALQVKLMIDQEILARSLAKPMRGTVVATRGNTGVGKSFRTHSILKDYLLENEHLIHGVLNPDYLKSILKKIDGTLLLNDQVHHEGRIIFERLLGTLAEKGISLEGAIVDTRLLTIEDFRKEVLVLAEKNNARLEIVDVDTSIWNSILAVLNREPFGKDPCVSFDVIRDGYVRARSNREKFIQESFQKKVNYSLYYLTKEGNYLQVAEKREGDTLVTIKESIFDDCLREPSKQEMEEVAQTLITPEWIESLEVSRSKEGLRKWVGFTVAEALDHHRLGKDATQVVRQVPVGLPSLSGSTSSPTSSRQPFAVKASPVKIAKEVMRGHRIEIVGGAPEQQKQKAAMVLGYDELVWRIFPHVDEKTFFRSVPLVCKQWAVQQKLFLRRFSKTEHHLFRGKYSSSEVSPKTN